jgi:hypothetical protein
MKTLGTVICQASLTDRGELLVQPQPGEVLDGLREFRRTSGDGLAVAQWAGPVAGPSGAIYNPLMVMLGQGESGITAAFVMPPDVRDIVPAGVLHVFVVLTEVEDPLDPNLIASDVIELDVPPLT